MTFGMRLIVMALAAFAAGGFVGALVTWIVTRRRPRVMSEEKTLFVLRLLPMIAATVAASLTALSFVLFEQRGGETTGISLPILATLTVGLFASAAIELPLAGRAWITGTLTQSHSTRADAGADALGLPSNRTDISGGVSWAAANRIALFGSVGRTLSRSHPTDTHLFVNGGVAVTFDGWK